MCENGNKNILAPLAGIMVALVAINVAFTYFLVDYKIKENNIKTYGSAENYEKATYMNDMQFDTLANLKMDDFRNQVNQARKMQGLSPIDGTSFEQLKISKEDMVVHTPIYGNEKAKFSIYEFTDIDCPWCQKLHQTGLLKQVVDKNSANLNKVVRNFPLDIHPDAKMKAELSLCINELSGKEKYFNYFDLVFGDEFGKTKEELLALSEKIGFDKTAVQTCLDSGKYTSIVNKDLELGTKMQVSGTPSIFLVNNETGSYEKIEDRSIEGIEKMMETLK